MSRLLEILGRGLLANLTAVFRDVLFEGRRMDVARRAATSGRRSSRAMGRRFRKAAELLHEGEAGAAAESFRDLLAAKPACWQAGVGLACALDEEMRTAEAAAILEALTAARPRDFRLLFGLAYCQERLGKSASARRSYQRCLDEGLEVRNARERLAAMALNEGRCEEAIGHYEQLCFLNPDDVALSLSLASLYVLDGRHEEAVTRFEYVLSLQPENFEARARLASSRGGDEDLEQRAARLEHLLESRADVADLHVQLGDVYAALGRHQDAQHAFEESLRLDPDRMESAIKLGTELLALGHVEEAARRFARAAELNDQAVDAFVGLGVSQANLGRMEEARTALELASSLDPNSTLLFSEVARLHLKAQGGGREGVEPFEIGPSVTKDSAILENAVEIQVRRIRAMLARYPTHADLHYRLGLLLQYLGEREEAAVALRNAVRINPQYVRALTRLGLVLRELGRHDEAMEQLNQALALDAQSAEIFYGLGLLFADRERFATALEYFQRASELCPSDLELHAHVALALENLGLIDKAQSAWETLNMVAKETGGAPEVVPRTEGD